MKFLWEFILALMLTWAGVFSLANHAMTQTQAYNSIVCENKVCN